MADLEKPILSPRHASLNEITHPGKGHFGDFPGAGEMGVVRLARAQRSRSRASNSTAIAPMRTAGSPRQLPHQMACSQQSGKRAA
jgi:hypothetical protein